MAIDVEDIKLCVCRIVHLSLRVSRRFVQKHPYVSGTLLFLFILYIFFPSVLSFLFYSLPFLGLAVILLAYRTSKKSTIRGEKKEEKKLEVSERLKKTTTTTAARSTIYRNRSAYLRNATSRRQRFTEKSESWKAESPVNASVGRTDQSVESDNSESLLEAKKETQSLESGNNASTLTTSIDKDIEVSGQNDPVLVSELLVKPDLAGFDGLSSQTTKSDSGGDETKIESSEDAEDEDEEEAQEDRNKAVEWTEDDQKNLMDLGLSEIERNRRLESLIARRRARKLYKRKVEETAVTVDIVPPGQIPKIITTRHDPLDVSELEGVQLPGSAPSILLPLRNPFDLPYDPHEEKPNLMADSFQQEFTAAHQKELAFCRHESFCFGPAFPDEVVGVGMGYHPRFRRPSISLVDKGEHDWLIEQLLFKGAEKNPVAVETRGVQTVDSSQTEHENAKELESNQGKEIPADSDSEFEMERELTPDDDAQASPSSSSDNPEAVICDDVGVISKTFESTLSSALNKSLNCRIPKSSRLVKEPLCDFSPTAFEKNKMDERFLYPEKVACHTPTYSIASDLQVEVSEIGSPPTVDGNNTDAESLNPDWEIEKEVNFGGEQDDTSPMTEEEERSNEIISGVEEEGEVKARSFSVPDNALPPKTIQGAIMAEKLVDHPSQVVPQMPEELSIPIPTDDEEESTNHIIDQKDAEAQANMKNMEKTSEDVVDGGLEILTKQEDDGKKTRSLEEETDLKFCKSSDDGSDNSSGYRAESDREHSEEESRNLDQIKGNGDLVEPRKIEEQLEFIQDDKNQPNVVESEFRSSKDALKSPVEDNSVTDRGVPLDSNDIIRSDASQNQVNAVQIEFQESNEAMKSAVEQDLVIQKEPQDHTREAELSPPESSTEEQIHGDKTLPQDFMVSPENNPKTRETDDNKSADSIEIKRNLIKDFSEQNGEKSNLDPMDDLEKTDQNLSSPNPALDADLKISEIIAQGDQAAANHLTEISDVEVEVVTEPTPDIVTNKNTEVEVVTEPELDIVTNKNTEVQVVTEPEPDIVTNKDKEVQVVTEPELDIVTNKNIEVEVVTEPAPDIVTNKNTEVEVVTEPELDIVTNKNIEVEVVTELALDIVTNKNTEVEAVTEPELDIVTNKNIEVEVVTEPAPDIMTNKNIEVQVVTGPTPDTVTNKNIEGQVVTESEPDIVTQKNIEDQVVTELEPDILTQKNMEGDGNYEVESESHRFNEQESDAAEEREMEFDKDMESYSKDLNGNEVKANVMGLQKPTGLAHESPLESSLSADKGSQ